MSPRSFEEHRNAAPQTGGVRFAPSPTGRFHVGNLRTAWISWRFAQALRLPWVVRFEDIDRPRVLAGARELQLADMAALGCAPDVVVDQSAFHARHLAVFEAARAAGALYACTCSRREVQTALAGLASAPHDGVAPVYSGHCRKHPAAAHDGAVAWRFKMDDESGRHDFIIARTDGDDFTPAYHWACAIDDFDGGYDMIVRSADLAPALSLQRAIMSWLGASRFPRAFHTSLVTQDDGHRLEKRTQGVTLPELAMSSAELVAHFAKSFDNRLLSETLDVAQESRATLKISDLLAT